MRIPTHGTPDSWHTPTVSEGHIPQALLLQRGSSQAPASRALATDFLPLTSPLPSPNLTRAAPQCCNHPHPEFIRPTATARPPQHASISLRVPHELLLTQLPLLCGAEPSTSILNLFFFVRLHSGTSLVPANALQSILKALHPKGTFYKVPELGNLATSLHLPEHCSSLEPGLRTDKSFCSVSFPQIFSSPEAAPNTQTAAFLPLREAKQTLTTSTKQPSSSHEEKHHPACIPSKPTLRSAPSPPGLGNLSSASCCL